MVLVLLTRNAVSGERHENAEIMCTFKMKNYILDCDRYYEVFGWTLEKRDDCYLEGRKLKEMCLDANRSDDDRFLGLW
jgi:hypothetical protein